MTKTKRQIYRVDVTLTGPCGSEITYSMRVRSKTRAIGMAKRQARQRAHPKPWKGRVKCMRVYRAEI